MTSFQKPIASAADHLFKVILIGDQSVGKTGLTLRFCDESFASSYVATIGIDFKMRTVNVDGKQIKLQIWDTAGQERFRTMTRVYYRGTMGVIFVYDITNRESFESINTWFKLFADATDPDIPKILVGNKFDKQSEREVGYLRAQVLASKYSMKVFETSAKTGYNVEGVFMTLARDILSRKAGGDINGQGRADKGVRKLKRREKRSRKTLFSRCNIL